MKGSTCTYAHSIEELQYAVLANAQLANMPSAPGAVATSATVFDVKEKGPAKPKDDELDALLNDIIDQETQKDKKAKKRKREAALPPLPEEPKKAGGPDEKKPSFGGGWRSTPRTIEEVASSSADPPREEIVVPAVVNEDYSKIPHAYETMAAKTDASAYSEASNSLQTQWPELGDSAGEPAGKSDMWAALRKKSANPLDSLARRSDDISGKPEPEAAAEAARTVRDAGRGPGSSDSSDPFTAYSRIGEQGADLAGWVRTSAGAPTGWGAPTSVARWGSAQKQYNASFDMARRQMNANDVSSLLADLSATKVTKREKKQTMEEIRGEAKELNSKIRDNVAYCYPEKIKKLPGMP